MLLIGLLLCALCARAAVARPAQVAILDLGANATAERAAAELARGFAAATDFAVVNRAQARAAAQGVSYKGSLNLSLAEARDLGAAVGCDFLVLGDAATVPRSPSDHKDYYEAYASLFFVSARTGRLLLWEQPSAAAADAPAAERALLAELARRAVRYAELLRGTRAAERDEKLAALAHDAPVIMDTPDADTPALRAPRPYRRWQPKYPEAAARMSAEATVDVLVEIDEQGEVGHVEVVRWAGYGLNEVVIETVRQMHFFPALRDGAPVAMRALLRYNFRKPQQANKN